MNLLIIVTQEVLIFLTLLLLFIYTLYHASTNKTLSSNQRVLRIAIILLANLLGWIANWIIGRNRDLSARQKEDVCG
ncbi:hypothetical protein HNP72_001317 [Sphingobacterium soli]|nr:hypothetical protein [Sphingobacterium soli]